MEVVINGIAIRADKQPAHDCPWDSECPCCSLTQERTKGHPGSSVFEQVLGCVAILLGEMLEAAPEFRGMYSVHVLTDRSGPLEPPAMRRG